jgi:hypothetical protein
MPFANVTSGSVQFRAWDLGAGVYAPVHMLADQSGAQVTPGNAFPVGGGYPIARTAQINASGSLTAGIDMDRTVLSGIILPATFDAADLTFQASADGTTYVDLFDGTAERTLTTAGALGKAVHLDSSQWLPWRWLKIRSGPAGAPVAQAATRVFTRRGVQ